MKVLKSFIVTVELPDDFPENKPTALESTVKNIFDKSASEIVSKINAVPGLDRAYLTIQQVTDRKVFVYDDPDGTE